MFIRLNQFEEAYRNITKKALNSPGVETVLIFVANDIDAMCACHMFVSLLKIDWIAHKIVPVSTYTEITSKCATIVDGNEDLQSIILINCGGTINLSDILTLNSHHLVYVFESQRPLNLTNLFGNPQVYVFDDGHIETDLKEERKAFEMLEFHDSDDESHPHPLDTLPRSSTSIDEASEIDPSELDHSSTLSTDLLLTSTQSNVIPTSPKTPTTPTSISFRHVMSSPFSSSSSSSPPSSTSSSLQPQNSSFSPSRVPIPSRKRKLSTHSDISVMSTQNLPNAKRKRADYEDQIYRYYTQSTSSQGTSVAYLSYLLLEHLGRLQLYHVWLAMIGLTEQRVHQKVSEATYLHFIRVYQRQVQRLNTPDDYLLKITEPNLILHRHWSVFMAMKYSPWIACKLGTWSEKGQSKLRLLLAKMGIPKDEYEKPFLHMDQSMKEDVIKELFTHAPTFGLEVAVWPTFLKPSLVMGGAISALDTVHGLIALSVSTTSSKTTSSFYTLYDTLVRLEDHWAMAFQMATTLKHSMFVLMASLIARQAVKKVPAMRYTLIKDGYDPRLLAHPACLRELGALLNATLMELHQPNVPLILCILMSSTKDQPNPRFLVHGCVLNNVVWSPNVLGYMFQQAAIKVKADHSYDRFDPTFIEISVADIMDFIEQVQILIARYNANQWTN